MQLWNQTRGRVMAEKLKIADSFWSRLKGLLGTKELPIGEALLIRPCNNIHMFGMKYSIDVVFADAANQVLKTVAHLTPGKIASCRGAAYVVEMPCGTLQNTGTEPGDLIEMKDA